MTAPFQGSFGHPWLRELNGPDQLRQMQNGRQNSYSKTSQFWREKIEAVGQPPVSTTGLGSAAFHTQHTPGFWQMLSHLLLTLSVPYCPF